METISKCLVFPVLDCLTLQGLSSDEFASILNMLVHHQAVPTAAGIETMSLVHMDEMNLDLLEARCSNIKTLAWTGGVEE